MSIRMGVQLGIFTQISQNPECGASSPEIAEKSGASLILVGKVRPSFTRGICVNVGGRYLCHLPPLMRILPYSA